MSSWEDTEMTPDRLLGREISDTKLVLIVDNRTQEIEYAHPLRFAFRCPKAENGRSPAAAQPVHIPLASRQLGVSGWVSVWVSLAGCLCWVSLG